MINLLPKRSQNSNKGSFGTVLNVSGSEMYSGAGILSSIAALRVGAGKVVLCSSKNTLSVASNSYPELVLQKRENINFDGVSSIILGCGLSQTNEAKEVFLKTISQNLPMIIDADGLNILAEVDYKLDDNVILTPHPKEMSRLMKTSVEDVLNNPENVIKQCVEKYKVIVVLKMHQTLVMDKNKNLYVNNTGNSALAKAGSGDVLAGLIGGFLAQGMNCFDASKLGVYLHGLAGELASEELTQYSVLAGDLLKYIPYAIKKILK